MSQNAMCLMSYTRLSTCS